MRAFISCAIVALLAAPQAVLAAKDGPDEAAAQPRRRNWLQRRADRLGAYNEQNAPGAYAALSAVGSALGLGGSVAVEEDDTGPKPKRQCLGTEGADGECQLSAEAVCAAYPSSDEAAAATPAIGLQSIVAVTGKSFRGMYCRVVELENPNRRGAGGQNKFKYKVKDSNGKDEFVFPAHLRPTSNEEENAFKDAETEAEAAKAAEQKLPKRLGGAPATMPGATVVAQPTDDEIKVVKDPMLKAMCTSGVSPEGMTSIRDTNYKLSAGLDLRQTVCLLDGARCVIARRENKECKRSYLESDVRKKSPREQLSNPASKTTRQTCRSRRRVDGVTREPLGTYSRELRDGLVPTQRNPLRAADVVVWFR